MRRSLIALAAIALLATACATDEGDPALTETEAPAATVEAADTDTVSVELGEWLVLPDPDAVRAGEINFEVTNGGEHPHEFVVIASDDVEPGELPTKDDGSVDEEKVDVVDEVEQLEPGDDGELAVDLEAGSYALVCNLVDEHEGEQMVHYKLGMRTEFTVS